MTQREKVLGAVVGVTVLSLGAIWGLSRLNTAFDDRNEQLDQVQREIEEKLSKVRRGKLAQAQLEGWKKRSLPSDLSRAQTQYRVWLFELTRQAGLQVDVKPAGQRRQGELYVQHMFQVTGPVELPRLIKFLHDFQGAGYLHRISALTARPLPEQREWDLTMTVEALSLTAAPAVVDGPPPPLDPPLSKDADAYAKAILRRNLLAPPNSPPRISAGGTQKGYPDRPLAFTIRASDNDKLDRLTYSLVAPGLDGATIDPRSGEFRWTPKKLGSDYSFVVRVTDDGTPPLSAEEKVSIAVVEPPPPAPREDPFARDDPARDARITATVGPPGKLQVWVTVPRGLGGDQPKTLRLHAGDPISVGSFVGVVSQVRDREAEFELKEGRRVIVRLEQPLVPPRELGGL